MSSYDNLPVYLFHQGTNYSAYLYLGCNLTRRGRTYVYTFRTWAPNANKVGLISDFTGWDSPVMMARISDKGVWELVYKSNKSLEKSAYKFRIYSDNGVFDKGDPYARFSRGLADGASLIYAESRYKWGDKRWLSYRKKTYSHNIENYLSCPINIYEVHFGSFMQHDDGTPLSYREMADILPLYVKSMGYTHVEFLPLTEFPYDGSWGYQVCGFFSPTSRFGDPDDLKYLVDAFHKAGIGVILDWVPAHFPKDAWGLYEFDGQPLYEYQGITRIESDSWGTRFFDLGREEVQSFLISSALYFLREYHIDGLRVDAVASMLYLNYDRAPGGWQPNSYGTNISLEGEAFFKKLNSVIQNELGDVLMIAEESGDYGKVTKAIDDGGLGFSMKWNMGWANDFYDYVACDPLFRKYKHKALNFPIMYAFSENYCLPISHDEVVHGKKSFVDKMFGSYEDKFADMRASLMLMMTYPGKKLLFMGTEYAQFREWDYENSLEWFMLDYPKHKEIHLYVKALNSFYLQHSELWEHDFDPQGFKWVLADENERNLVAFRRINSSLDELIVVINFSGVEEDVRLPIECEGIRLDTVFASFYMDDKQSYPITSLASYRFADVHVPAHSGLILKPTDNKIKIKI